MINCIEGETMIKNTRNLFKTLRALQKDVDREIDSLNCGGCGVFAYLVGEKLESLGLFVEIVTPCNYGDVPAKIARNGVNNLADPEEWSNNGLSRRHLAIRFKTFSGVVYTYDSDAFYKSAVLFGEWEYNTNPEIGTGLTVEETKLMSSQQTGWNRSFNRNQIPKLKRIINNHFN